MPPGTNKGPGSPRSDYVSERKHKAPPSLLSSLPWLWVQQTGLSLDPQGTIPVLLAKA